MLIHPPPSCTHLSEFIRTRFQNDPSAILFVVFDKITQPNPVLAGIIALTCASSDTLSTELGWVIILPAFQRTHVTTNAAGLLLHYCLDAPSSTTVDDPITGTTPGIGLRRVQWQARQDNERSIRAAIRLGFRQEGNHRWARPLPPGKMGAMPRASDPKSDHPGCHTVILGLCWDDWEAGGRDKVRAMLYR